jgi:hypothetical protein
LRKTEIDQNEILATNVITEFVSQIQKQFCEKFKKKTSEWADKHHHYACGWCKITYKHIRWEKLWKPRQICVVGALQSMSQQNSEGWQIDR